MTIIFAILLFSFLIFIHELGHFAAAKLSGVQVNEFALFMGPAIWQKQVGETLYSLRCIPIGGYCAMEGEDGDSDNPRAFSNAKVWKRLIILVAGAVMNLIIGFIMVVIFVGFYYGEADVLPSKQVAMIEDGRPFAQVLQVGDEFYEINGRRVFVNSDITLLLDREASGVHDIVVIRNGEKVELSNVTMKCDYKDPESGRLRYGFTCEQEECTVGSVLSYSVDQSLDFGRLVWMSLGDLVSGRASVKDMGGPVMIVETVTQAGVASETVGLGVLNVIYFFAFIAINLAVMNLLPIPALDGGRVVCLLVTAAAEKILRRKIDPKYEGYLHAGFMLLLLALMAFITFKDVIGLFN